ncbi:PREDICTED: uncharacterized protein LOC104817560 [Tarenaya hassleriana]|uniref:uncharacterized protein LOC104817560 n=1 Tax=Tarenaya hassleriana TaxID=28532 RepID=UPI00053C9095|nr:PREDICTED: uncharacterized protein LOC104817560 [Tarenaya hassleriana]
MVLNKRSRTPSSASEQTESPEILEGAVAVPSPEIGRGQLQSTVLSLEQCWFCTKKLSPEEDIFMYGDLAFCSKQCRERQRISDRSVRLREEARKKKGKTCSGGVMESEDCTITTESLTRLRPSQFHK